MQTMTIGMNHESHESTRRGRTANVEHPTPEGTGSRQDATTQGGLGGFAALREAPFPTWARRAAEAALGAAIVAIPFVTLWAVEATQRWMEGRP